MRPLPNPLQLLSFTVVISIHLSEDFVRPFLRSGFIFRHVHHGRDHFVDGLAGGEGVRVARRGHLALPTRHRGRALGFAPLGKGLVFNALPMGSGLQLPAQPGLELLLQGGLAAGMPLRITSLGFGQGEHLLPVCQPHQVCLGTTARPGSTGRVPGWGDKGTPPGRGRTRDKTIPDSKNKLTPGTAKPWPGGPRG